MKRLFSYRAYGVVLSLLVTAGCTLSNGDVNRVQPNYIRKADLLGDPKIPGDGEWFFRNSVSYTPHNTQFTYPGQTGNMEKLVWEIQEGNLVGYRSYPFIVGADPSVDPSSIVSGTTAKYCDAQGTCTGGHQYYGAPVVAFPILSHFDIARGYNPATGEQTNVISENSTDRPWNQREFMRVNWAANVLNVNSGMNWGTVQNPVGGSSNANWIQPNEPGSDPYDWPTFEFDPSNKKLKYFDVTGRYMAAPDTVYYDGYGYIPLCYFANGPYDCSSSEIKMRISVSKVDLNWSRDFEPLFYPNDLMSMFGYFRVERLNWDKKYGVNDSAVIRIATRHRTWDSYYQKDANGQPDPAQPIPLTDRKAKPVVYYFTRADRMGGQERYDEFMEPARKVLEKDYDKAFRRATAAAKGMLGDDDWKSMDPGFILCDNPVKADSPNYNEACGVDGFSPKFGDLRYSFVNTVAEPVANGLLGYGPSSYDPETGQIMAGNSNTYLWGVDLYGRTVLDWVLLLSGETQVNSYISGQQMRDYLANHQSYNVSALNASNQLASLQSELQGIPQRSTQTKGAFDRPSQRIVQLKQTLAAQNGLPKASRDELKAAADQLAKYPELEAAVLDNPDVQNDLVNLLPPWAQERAKTDSAFMRQVSRSTLTNIQDSQAWNKARIAWASQNNITLAEFSDRTLIGLANEKLVYRKARITALTSTSPDVSCGANASQSDQTKWAPCTLPEAANLANQEIMKQVRQSVWLATTLHELGHTMNLRHNFQGSYDSINYGDTYWDLRKLSLTMEQNGEQKLPRTANDMKAAFDNKTAIGDAQRVSGMHNYEYSSIMDYAGKIYGDWQGLGKYDYAAIMFAYSGGSEPNTTGIATPGYVEVFNSARKDSKSFAGTDGNMMTISGAGADLPMVNVTHLNPNTRNYTERFHYTTVPLHFGEGPDITSTINDGIAKLRSRKLVKWSEVQKDEARVAQLLADDPTLIDDPDRAAGVLGNPMLRVPYMFCSDDSADGPVLSCNRFDRGPDYYEMMRTKLEDYWNYYYDSHFRKDRLWFSGNSAINGTFNTFYEVANSYKHWVFEMYKSGDKNQEQITHFKLDPMFQDAWTLSVIDGVNEHLNVMSVPPFGLFMYRNLRSGPQWDVISSGDDYDMLNAYGQTQLEDLYTSRYGGKDYVVLPRGLGRNMYSRYDFKSGFGFWTRMSEAGHYNDQLGAMFAAVIPGLNLQAVDDTADQNRYNIPYYLVFRPEITSVFGALWASDEPKVRPVLYRTYDDAHQLTTTPALFNRVYVKGQDLFDGFNYPQPELQLCQNGKKWPTCFEAEQNAAPANIQLTWTSRIYAIWLGMALFRVNYDLDYSKANQVYRLGGNEQFTVANGYHTVEVPDVTTGSRYLAVERDDYVAYNSTPAVRMINMANDYLTMVNNPATCPLPDYIFMQGYACLPADQANNPAVLEDRRRYWTEIFRDQIRDMDLQRSFYSAFGTAF